MGVHRVPSAPSRTRSHCPWTRRVSARFLLPLREPPWPSSEKLPPQDAGLTQRVAIWPGGAPSTSHDAGSGPHPLAGEAGCRKQPTAPRTAPTAGRAEPKPQQFGRRSGNPDDRTLRTPWPQQLEVGTPPGPPPGTPHGPAEALPSGTLCPDAQCLEARDVDPKTRLTACAPREPSRVTVQSPETLLLNPGCPGPPTLPQSTGPPGRCPGPMLGVATQEGSELHP